MFSPVLTLDSSQMDPWGVYAGADPQSEWLCGGWQSHADLCRCGAAPSSRGHPPATPNWVYNSCNHSAGIFLGM